MTAGIFIGGVAHALGEPKPVKDLPVAGDRDVLSALLEDGLRDYRESAQSRAMLGARSFAATLDSWGRDPTEIDLVLYCSESMGLRDQTGEEFDSLCREKGLGKVPVVGLSLSTCANLVPALRFARSLIRSEGLRNVAVVAADKSPDENRITRMNLAVMSDGASSCIVSSRPLAMSFRLCGMSQATDQLLRNLDHRTHWPRSLAITANGVRKATRDAVCDAGLEMPAIRHMYCSTLRLSSVRFFAQQCRIEFENVFTGSLADISHVYSCDFLINLAVSSSWRAERGLRPGDPFLALLMGPSTWGAVVAQEI